MFFSRLPPCWRVSIFLLALLLSLLTSSCAAPTRFRPARTLKKGTLEASATFEGLGHNHIEKKPEPGCYDCEGHGPSLGVPPWLPHPGLAIRYGITDGLELGAGLSFTTLRVDLTAEILETPLLDLAVGGGFGVEHLFLIPLAPSLSLPLIIDLNLRPWLVLTPYVGAGGWFPLADRDPLLVAETGVGLEIRPTSFFALRPHFARLWPLGPNEQLMSIMWDEPLTALYSFGLDLAFGGTRK